MQDIRIGGRQSNSQYQYTLQADDLALLRAWEGRIRAALSNLPQLVDVNTDTQDKGLQTSIVIDRDAGVGEAGEGAKAMLDNALMAQTKAVQNGHIVYLDPHAAYIAFGGYTALNRLLDQLTEALSAQS